MRNNPTVIALFILAFVFINMTDFALSARVLDEDPETAAASPMATMLSPVAAPVSPVITAPAVSQPADVATTAITGDYKLSFFMHDVLGATNPSARVVTGIVSNAAVNGQLTFAKSNGGSILPPNNGVPLFNGNNPNHVNNINGQPFLTGVGGGNLVQNNNAGNQLPFVTAGQLPAGAIFQQMVFGTITVIDDELTEGHELGSTVIGKAQGFYLASSKDGSSQTMALTAMFEGGGGYVDTVSFFGVHRTAASETKITVIGGTGKYENANGYATIQTLHPVDQHTTDGVETLLQFTVYLSY